MKSPLAHSLMNRVQGWFSHAHQTATDSQEKVCDLPETTRQLLAEQLAELPVPVPYVEALQTACGQAIADWQEGAGTTNVLVIMTEPVVPLPAILCHALDHSPLDTVNIHYPLADYDRPAEPLIMSTRFYQALEPLIGEMETSDGSRENAGATRADGCQRRQVIVVPALEECFLRSIHGWQTIEDLQTHIVENPAFFWIIGCSSWAWAFLDRVCHISAYLEQVYPLPAMTEEELEQWLSPLVKEAIVAGAPDATRTQADAGNRESYWKALTRLSEGHSTIAAQLWLQSLGIQEKNWPQEAEASRSPDDLALCLRKPVLPTLPELTQLDRYLLHSLLIHSALTQEQLTVSLGESATQVRSRVQILRRDGMVMHQQGHLTLAPAHFPRLRSELSTNNFLTGKVP